MINKIVYSIGHSNVTFDRFIDILKTLKIEYLIDVSSVPISSYVPHFNKNNLENSLADYGIEYLYAGEKLGGRQKLDISKYAKTKEFKLGINKIEDIIKTGITAIMCSEKDFKKCHRRFICDALINEGYNVIQFEVDNKKIDKHLQLSLFNGEKK